MENLALWNGNYFSNNEFDIFCEIWVKICKLIGIEITKILCSSLQILS